ncbi:hypothetical protein J1605_000646 [Eschrichtius robustus]|uniref:Uncharacterized protein n=1 Tax=Eschrichtius robustus TaxID=9764 RepID=A0AB34GKM9_ESCRO|nr:hypothetical protein J1605_000646 [Eschrichtius robustus]
MWRHHTAAPLLACVIFLWSGPGRQGSVKGLCSGPAVLCSLEAGLVPLTPQPSPGHSWETCPSRPGPDGEQALSAMPGAAAKLAAQLPRQMLAAAAVTNSRGPGQGRGPDLAQSLPGPEPSP